jgi:hypothetical protein
MHSFIYIPVKEPGAYLIINAFLSSGIKKEVKVFQEVLAREG